MEALLRLDASQLVVEGAVGRVQAEEPAEDLIRTLPVPRLGRVLEEREKLPEDLHAHAAQPAHRGDVLRQLPDPGEEGDGPFPVLASEELEGLRLEGHRLLLDEEGLRVPLERPEERVLGVEPVDARELHERRLRLACQEALPDPLQAAVPAL